MACLRASVLLLAFVALASQATAQTFVDNDNFEAEDRELQSDNTTALEWLGADPPNLAVCQGDCDNDGDCPGDSMCIQRTGGSPAAVLGCTAGDSGDSDRADTDYCSNPPQVTGADSCPCIEKNKPFVKCHASVDDQCACNDATGASYAKNNYSHAVGGGGYLLAEDYGESCKPQLEPGLFACSDNTGALFPTECTSSQTPGTDNCYASWCAGTSATWCYVDPCNCDVEESVQTAYFGSPPLYYNYNTCGGMDTWTSVTTHTSEVEAAGGVCASTITPVAISDMCEGPTPAPATPAPAGDGATPAPAGGGATPAPASATPAPAITTTLAEEVAAGATMLKLADVAGLAVDMYLTISDATNSETKKITEVTPDRRLAEGRRLAAGSVTLEGALTNGYAAGVSISSQTTDPNAATAAPTTEEPTDASPRKALPGVLFAAAMLVMSCGK